MLLKQVMLPSIRQYYGRVADRYESRWGNFSEPYRRWILENLPSDLPPEPRVLDMGCGTGKMLALLKEKYPQGHFTGIDASPEMLQEARKNISGADFQIGDLMVVDLPEQGYDLILSLNVLHHLNNPEGHIGHLEGLCAPGGYVFLCDFALETWPLKIGELVWRGLFLSHHQAYGQDELRTLLQSFPNLKIEKEEILKPSGFWRLQIYRLRKAR